MNTRDLILRILKAEAKSWKLYDAACKFKIEMQLDLDLLDVALDMLDVPADNTVETNAMERADCKTGRLPKGSYCRDWCSDAWMNCKYDPEKFIRFIEKNNRSKKTSIENRRGKE